MDVRTSDEAILIESKLVSVATSRRRRPEGFADRLASCAWQSQSISSIELDPQRRVAGCDIRSIHNKRDRSGC
ncbi:hypothetical protein KCU73_g62, partial [Aureobasidium melanogenum]